MKRGSVVWIIASLPVKRRRPRASSALAVFAGTLPHDDDGHSDYVLVDFRTSRRAELTASDLMGVLKPGRKSWIRRESLFTSKEDAERVLALKELAR